MQIYIKVKILGIYKKYNFSFDQLFRVEDAVQNLKDQSLIILYQAMLLAQNLKQKSKY